uniref:Arrestin-like N-terminal domain-containing protein n=1 Tax=Eutreptiella gymnastica TaxID=73025 RepID=A0A7S1I479_9EUGL|mmetsp:Transcript_129081/g.223078  ORF Transcript_129081/g.223078 Transcript_129081/m.223078 type:complete len:298 (+) Transcript_129081:163-1056(+)
MSVAGLALELSHSSHTYDLGEPIAGQVLIECNGQASCGDVKVTLTGTLSCRSKSVPLVQQEMPVSKPSSLPHGVSRFSFQFPAPGTDVQSYEGQAITVKYQLSCELGKYNLFGRTWTTQCDVWVRSTGMCRRHLNMPVSFRMDGNALRPKQLVATGLFEDFMRNLGEFDVMGVLDTVELCAASRFQGSLCVRRCGLPIRSIELQFIQLELFPDHNGTIVQSCSCALANEVVHGDPCRGMQIGMEMQLPTIRCCPTLRQDPFSIEFEIHLVVYFKDFPAVYEKFPITVQQHSTHCVRM